METVYTREYLLKGANVSSPGFKHNPLNRLATTKQLPTILSIETRHIERDLKTKNEREITPLLEYQLWLEAGKLDKANFKSSNSASSDGNSVCYSSNIWRNFRNSCGVDSNRKGTISESIATLYPMQIPVPSQVGSNTLAKYYRENKNALFKSEKSYELSLIKTEKEDSYMKYLRLKSEMRNPPLDASGNILPPRNFKSYKLASSAKSGRQTQPNPSSAGPGLNASAKPAADGDPAFVLSTSAHSKKAQNLQVPAAQSSSRTPTTGGSPRSPSRLRKLVRPPFRPKKIVFRENHPDFSKVIIEQQVKEIYKAVTDKA